jgi:hypothetical protein
MQPRADSILTESANYLQGYQMTDLFSHQPVGKQFVLNGEHRLGLLEICQAENKNWNDTI